MCVAMDFSVQLFVSLFVCAHDHLDIENAFDRPLLREKWSPEVKNYCPGTPIVLVGMKPDFENGTESRVGTLRSQDQNLVPFEDGLQIAKEIGDRLHQRETKQETEMNYPNVFFLPIVNSVLVCSALLCRSSFFP